MSVDINRLKRGDIVTLKATFVEWAGGFECLASLLPTTTDGVAFAAPADTIVAFEEHPLSIGDIVKLRDDNDGYIVREFCDDFVLLKRIVRGRGLSPYHSCRRHLVRRA